MDFEFLKYIQGQGLDLTGVNLDKFEAKADWGDVLRSLEDQNPGRFGRAEQLELLRLQELYDEKVKYSGYDKWFVDPYPISMMPKHKEFFDSGKWYPERLLMGGNRCSKTVSGSFELARHATGEYPDWWEGRRFDRPIRAWAAGQTAQTTRDTVQKELVGPLGGWGTGMIPRQHLIGSAARTGVTGALDYVLVRHVPTGGTSIIGFKSYDQEIKSFYGVDREVIWLDEEPPMTVYGECVMRLMTTNGIIYVTCTPLHGVTEFIHTFAKDAEHLAGAKRLLAKVEDKNDE